MESTGISFTDISQAPGGLGRVILQKHFTAFCPTETNKLRQRTPSGRYCSNYSKRPEPCLEEQMMLYKSFSLVAPDRVIRCLQNLYLERRPSLTPIWLCRPDFPFQGHVSTWPSIVRDLVVPLSVGLHTRTSHTLGHAVARGSPCTFQLPPHHLSWFSSARTFGVLTSN